MERRKFMIGLGSAAAGSAALVGSSAFSTGITGDRTVTVDVVGDGAGLIGLYPSGDGPAPDEPSNGQYADYDGEGRLFIDITGDVDFGMGPWNGEGVNPDSTYRFDHVFEIVNQGHEPNTPNDTISAWVSKNTVDEVDFYWSGDRGTTDFGDDAETVESDMTPGTFDRVGLEVDASGLEEGDEISGEIEISAETEGHDSTI